MTMDAIRNIAYLTNQPFSVVHNKCADMSTDDLLLLEQIVLSGGDYETTVNNLTVPASTKAFARLINLALVVGIAISLTVIFALAL